MSVGLSVGGSEAVNVMLVIQDPHNYEKYTIVHV